MKYIYLLVISILCFSCLSVNSYSYYSDGVYEDYTPEEVINNNEAKGEKATSSGTTRKKVYPDFFNGLNNRPRWSWGLGFGSGISPFFGSSLFFYNGNAWNNSWNNGWNDPWLWNDPRAWNSPYWNDPYWGNPYWGNGLWGNRYYWWNRPVYHVANPHDDRPGQRVYYGKRKTNTYNRKRSAYQSRGSRPVNDDTSIYSSSPQSSYSNPSSSSGSRSSGLRRSGSRSGVSNRTRSLRR